MYFLFYRIWLFLKHTVLNVTWWKKHWYLPWILLVSIVVWTISGGSGSAAGLVRKSNEIRKEDREKQEEIEATYRRLKILMVAAAENKKAKIEKAAEENFSRELAKLKKQRELIQGDSEAINKEINNALNN